MSNIAYDVVDQLLSGTQELSNFNLKIGYNQIRIKECDNVKIALHSHLGYYE